MASSGHSRRQLVVALTAAAIAVVSVVALVVAPTARGVVDGLRVLGGAGVEVEEPTTSQDATVDGEVAPDADPSWPLPADAQPAVVDRVVDGDTLRVGIEEAGGPIGPTDSVRVRLLNVDAPELDHPRRGEDCGAGEATAFLEALVPPGSEVYLVADTRDRDDYDRPLRGVWSADGLFVNAELVRAGWAEVVLFEPNDRFHAPLPELEATATADGRGAWGICDGFPG